MLWLITRHKAEKNYVLSVVVVFLVFGMPGKLWKFCGTWIVFPVIKGHFKK